jgi:hypothetical protein
LPEKYGLLEAGHVLEREFTPYVIRGRLLRSVSSRFSGPLLNFVKPHTHLLYLFEIKRGIFRKCH